MNSRFHIALCALLVAAATVVGPARAEADERAVTATTVVVRSADIDRAVRALPDPPVVRVAPVQRTASRPALRQDSRGPGRIIAGAAVGALGGFFGGAYLGASLEPDCNCDDPGFKGFLIGAPIGAVVGGILGGKFLF